MSEHKEILRTSKESLLRVVSSVLNVNDVATLFFRKLGEKDERKVLVIDEYNQSRIFGIKATFNDISHDNDVPSLRFDITKLSKWLPLVEGEILVSSDGANISFTLASNPERNITSPLIQEVEREPKVNLLPYPSFIKVPFLDLDNAQKELSIVGETLEIDVGETIKLSCSAEGSNVRTPLNVKEKSYDESQHGKYRFNHEFFASSLKGLSLYSDVTLRFGKKGERIYPLILEASDEKSKVMYGISPRLEK